MEESLPDDMVMVGEKHIKLVAKRTKSACVNCKAAKVGCGATRPCLWCIRHGLEASCVEAPKKARKPRSVKRKIPDTDDEIIDIKPDIKDLILPNATHYNHNQMIPYPLQNPATVPFPNTPLLTSTTLDFDPSILELINYSDDPSQPSSIFNPHLTLDQLIEMASDDGVPNLEGESPTTSFSPTSTSTDEESGREREEGGNTLEDGAQIRISNTFACPSTIRPSSISTTPSTTTTTNTTTSTISNTTSTSTSTPNYPLLSETNSSNNTHNSNTYNSNTPNNTHNNTTHQTGPIFNANPTQSTFINNTLTTSIMSSIFAGGNYGESTPNFGAVIFQELGKIQKSIETITVLTQIQQQPVNATDLSANTSPYPIALFSLQDPVVLQQCNSAFAQMLGYHNVHDASLTRLDRLLPIPFQAFALRRIKKTASNDVPKKLSHLVFKSQTAVDMIICVAVIKRINSTSCMMAIIKHTRASPELRTEMARFVDKVGLLSQAVAEVVHLKKSIKLGEVRKPAHLKIRPPG